MDGDFLGGVPGGFTGKVKNALLDNINVKKSLFCSGFILQQLNSKSKLFWYFIFKLTVFFQFLI